MARGSKSFDDYLASNVNAVKDWDTSSVEGMEATAKEQHDKDCSVKIGQHWLCVTWVGGDKFTYQWGKNLVSRDNAVEVHKMKGK